MKPWKFTRHLIQKGTNEEIAYEIDKLMMHIPE